MRVPAARLIRRRRNNPADGTFFKKEHNVDQAFFAQPVHETFFHPAPATVHRKCESCDDEEKHITRKTGNKEDEEKRQRLAATENKKADTQPTEKKKEEEGKMLHRSPEKKEEEKERYIVEPDKKEEEKKRINLKEGVSQAGPSIQTSSYINALDGTGDSLPDNTRRFFAQRMGYDFPDVRIHSGNDAKASAKELNARAYAFKNHIVFNDGEYDPDTFEGKKLLAHELAHTVQNDGANLSLKEHEDSEQECTAGSIDLEAFTSAAFKKNAGIATNEKTFKAKGCPECGEECVTITGTLQVPFEVDTNIKLPSVPSDLSPCQQDRVRNAINGPLLAHENLHVKAFSSFRGKALLPVNYKGCEGSYSSYQETLAENEFQRRKSAAEKASDALDPFSVPVDLCCIDKPAGKTGK